MSRTHGLAVVDGWLTKTYASWDRGEHIREWTALRRIHECAPDLVPRPLSADLDARPPTITMSVLPGTPLSGPLDDQQLTGLATALVELWSVPKPDLAPRWPADDDDLAGIRGLLIARTRPAHGIEADAYDAALDWWDGPGLDQFRRPYPDAVIGHGDPNLSNYLWDGERVRIVDFEDAGRSDIAMELATLVEHISARDTDWDAFLGRFDVDPARLRAARAIWAIFWFQMLLPGGRSAGRNPPEVRRAQAARVLARTSNGVQRLLN